MKKTTNMALVNRFEQEDPPTLLIQPNQFISSTTSTSKLTSSSSLLLSSSASSLTSSIFGTNLNLNNLSNETKYYLFGTFTICTWTYSSDPNNMDDDDDDGENKDEDGNNNGGGGDNNDDCKYSKDENKYRIPTTPCRCVMYRNNLLEHLLTFLDRKKNEKNDNEDLEGEENDDDADNYKSIFKVKCDLCSHSLDQHLQYFRSSKPSLFDGNNIAILDDYLYKAVDSFHLMCLYSQATLFQKRPLFTIYNLINGYLCNYVDVEYNYRQPPFEMPTIEQLLNSIANNNNNNHVVGENMTVRKYSEIFLRLFDRHKFQSISIDRTQEQSEQLKEYRPSEIFGRSHLLSIIDILRQDFDKHIHIDDENYQIFRNLIITECPFITDSDNMNSNSSNAANQINVTPSMDDRRSKSPHNSSITSSRLRRHSLDYILTDGIRVCDVERLYQHQNEIFDRCSCVRTITFGSPSIVGGGGGGDDSAAIRNEDLIFIRIDPLTFEPANALMEIKHFIVRSAAILINDRLKRMGSMNVRDKLFSDNVTTLVLIHRPTGRLLAVLTYDFRPIENLGELIFLVVRPKYQRRGYGSMLLSIMSKIIIPNCAEYAVHADLGAIEFYRRIGFVQEMNTKEIQRLERFMGQYTGSILMRVNRTTMIEKLRNLTLTSVELITLDDIQPTRSHCPIHIGLKSTTLQHHPGENNNNNNNNNSKLNEITDEELRTFHHTIREHFAPLMVATQNDRDSLAESRGFVKRFFNDYNNLFSLKEYNPDLMNIDLLRILYYRLLWFIAHCQWKYRRDDKLTIARKAECHLKRLMVFKFGIEEMF
ncbi:Histone acetyltransferase kat2b [Dermatophagoides farinae]|uniref:Histone acetyltransferase kat2b n=1 Tax=Dermatophagoides farinae TaxID=6954 RepID=A0A922L337_DERFA|nr:Histone acetyltransferase kat2b [Dermatophagoides farinae]